MVKLEGKFIALNCIFLQPKFSAQSVYTSSGS
jgi:hypothetical protein